MFRSQAGNIIRNSEPRCKRTHGQHSLAGGYVNKFTGGLGSKLYPGSLIVWMTVRGEQ